MIEFDKRIINPKLIFTPSECRNDYIAKRLQMPVYFTNSFDDFANINKCKMGFLAYINDKKPNPYIIVRDSGVMEPFECKYIVFSKNVKTLLTENKEVSNHNAIDPILLLTRISDFLTGFDSANYNEGQETYELHCARVLVIIRQIADSVLKLKK